MMKTEMEGQFHFSRILNSKSEPGKLSPICTSLIF